jgi:hypothetical protein
MRAALRVILICLAIAPSPAGATELFAGGRSFSDELGGFRLLSARGAGTSADPVVVTEEFLDAAPATLVIRNRAAAAGEPGIGDLQFTLVKHVINHSQRVWAGFELELQETLGAPSDYGDGLSFKQFDSAAADVASDLFAKNERLFEPYDRIEFSGGAVDPDRTVMIRVTITDPTPVPEFYLVQDPKLLSSALPLPRAVAAARPLRGNTGRATSR